MQLILDYRGYCLEDMKQTSRTSKLRRNQFTKTMRQSNARQKMRPPLGAFNLLETLTVKQWFDERQERAYSGITLRLLGD